MVAELNYFPMYASVGCNYLTREDRVVPFDFEDLYDIHLNVENGVYEENNYRLILRPLSDMLLDEWKSHNMLQSYSIELLLDGSIPYERFDYMLIKWLIEHHFDVFDLIGGGLAVNINTMEK